MQTSSIVLPLVLAVTSAGAQDMTVKVWTEGAPGARQSVTYHEETVRNDRDLPRISKVTDPELLVYLAPKGKATGSAVIVCPGGGYGILAIDHEGHDIAKWLNGMGIAGIVLKYRLPSDEIMDDKSVGALQDVQEAIRIVRRRAGEWGISPDKIGVMGFSAGGHLAGTASTMYAQAVYPAVDNVSARPDFSILIYGVLSMQDDVTHRGSKTNLLGEGAGKDKADRFSNELHVDENTPPAFLVHSADDTTVPVDNSLLYYRALVEAGVAGELHIYESGGHGYGLAPDGDTERMWPAACGAWLKKQGWAW